MTGGYHRYVAVTTGAKLDAHTLRKDFPIFEQEFHGKPLAYLDSAASSQKPRQMLDAMEAFYETSYANVHRGVYELAERATEGLETAREKVRVLLNAPAAREVIFVRNATEGINLVAYAWGLSNLGPGDVVLVTELEHHSNFVPWQYVAKRTGAEFRMIPLTDEGDLVLDGLDGLVGDGSLKVVALNLVSNALGTVNGVERINEWAHGRGAIVVVDAAQAAPHRAVDVQAVGCDFVAISGHKMCAPSGIGAVWGRADLLERMEPFMLGGHMIRKVQADERPGATSRTSSKRARRRWPRRLASVPRSTTSTRSASRRSSSTSMTSPRTRWVRSRTSRPPGSSGLHPSAAPASSRSRSTAFTRTTLRRCWTGKASPFAPATTAASR